MSFSQKNMHEHVYTDTHISAACFFPLNARFQAFRALKGNIYIYICNQSEKPRFTHACVHGDIHTYAHTGTNTYKGR